MKDKIISIVFVTTLIFFFCFGILNQKKSISILERRKLATFPEGTVENILSGDFFSDFDQYLVDHFPLRDSFRKLKGITALSIFQKKENNGVFIKDDTIYQLDNHLNEDSVKHLLKLMNKIKTQYLKTDSIYYSIIPDKNYYLEDSSIPRLDYQKLEALFKEQLLEMKYISLLDTLDQDAYYRTDIHWRQEKLEKAVHRLEREMNLRETKLPTEKKTYPNFYGALYGRIASNVEPDELTYLTNKQLENITVYNYEKKQEEKVYTDKYLQNVDSYDVFLSGATPLLIIDNPYQTNKKELILFRDSFGSSITPLLISSYSKITVIDLRYLSSSLLDKIPEIVFTEDQDVLFLYSVPIINNSFTLK